MNNTSQVQKTIAVVGLGYVGLPLALLADRKEYRVYGIDVDEKKVELLRKRVSPFHDEKISSELLTSRMEPTTDWSKIALAEVIIICVPTPVYENHLPNLEPVQKACEKIAPFLKKGHVVILESTVNPGVCEGVVAPILEKISLLRAGNEFHLAHCPERINPGDKKWSVENIPRVIGATDEAGLEKAAMFYESILTGTVKRMGSIKEAEAVKIVENSFRDINIAFVNELAQSFAHLGINVVNVIDGAATKPFAFMAHYPGCGVGGHCIPVDPYYLIDYARKNGFVHRFLSLARTINNEMPLFTVDLTEQALNEVSSSLKTSRVAVLGLAYKPDIDDCRESPSLHIISILKKRGAKISVYDPHVLKKSSAKSLEEALAGADAAIIATAHSEFKNIKPELLTKHNVRVIIDGRNCLKDKDFSRAGIVYRGIGKQPCFHAIRLGEQKTKNSPKRAMVRH